MKTIRLITVLVCGIAIANTASARYDWSRRNNSGNTSNNGNSLQVRTANCAPTIAKEYLQLNDVKALIETGGSMWQNRATGTAAYEVPKGSGKTAIYSGSLWMGGTDVNNQLKLAAVRFRSVGNDFWAGPLTVIPGTGNMAIGIKDHGPASIEPEVCLEYDKFYITTRQEIATFAAWHQCTTTEGCDPEEDFPNYSIPNSILNWPAHGDPSKFQDFYLAPFYDHPNSVQGVYDPTGGDYPYYDLNKEVNCRTSRQVTLYGDYNMWWVFNDKGNVHTETNGEPIGMEIRAQAFAFATNDEVNSMTFYNYEMINRSTQTLKNTYFAVYVDSDLGAYNDDYVGCDVQRGLGYCYNGDAVDDGQSFAYGENPPAIGVDFFEGPYQDNDGINNPLTTDISAAINGMGIPYKGLGIGYGDSTENGQPIIDNERFGMRRFVYYTNGGSLWGTDPNTAVEHYNYMSGYWKDGTRILYGGTGHVSDPDATSTPCNYCFPGDSDPLNWGTAGAGQSPWSEQSEQNFAGDRRFVQAAGPFTLEPGALNNITVGVVFARAYTGDPFESVNKLRIADDKAQALFDNCFRILNGPDAPDVTIQELDRSAILYLSNPSVSNNYLELYEEVDPQILALDVNGTLDTKYRFQGYKVFQLSGPNVTPSQLDDLSFARQVKIMDKKDGVTTIVNQIFDQDLGIGVPTLMVQGTDNGISHSLKVSEDLFAQGDTRMINHKKYYYMVVAYGYNNYANYDPATGEGQQYPYKESRKNAQGGSISIITVIPHIVNPESQGTIQVAQYGDGPEITRIEGGGHGRMVVDITEESISKILADTVPMEVTYQKKKGPFEVKVIDPLSVTGGDYEVWFHKDQNSALAEATWTIVNLTTGDSVHSDRSIQVAYEQLIPEWGIGINIEQYVPGEAVVVGGTATKPAGDVLYSEMLFGDSTKRWLSGLADGDGADPTNWIRIGTFSEPDDPDLADCEDPYYYNDAYTASADWEKIVGGTWGPYAAIAKGSCDHTPLSGGVSGSAQANSNLAASRSVDIVITADRSKWTRAVVFETQENPALSWNQSTAKMEVKMMPSIDKYGNRATDAQIAGEQVSTNPEDANFTWPMGMSWFPGYAIDVTTGERLNIAFGEDSWLGNEGGKDMKWNPSGNVMTGFGDYLFGGKHFVYVYGNQSRIDGPLNTSTFKQGMPAYDNGTYFRQRLIKRDNGTNPSTGDKNKVWRSCMWVGAPMLAETAASIRSSQDMASFIETDVTIKIRTTAPYHRYCDGQYFLDDANASSNVAKNEWYGLYRFNMDDLATITGNANMADSALALVNVVPNPYYAYSNYEFNRLENIVKIVNLPDECSIDIYSVSGSLVKSFNKASKVTSVDWDLTNHVGVPIASGLYLIHVKATLIDGRQVERVIKWFGALRPPDIQNF